MPIYLVVYLRLFAFIGGQKLNLIIFRKQCKQRSEKSADNKAAGLYSVGNSTLLSMNIRGLKPQINADKRRLGWQFICVYLRSSAVKN
jgi:hypothetical protein